MRTTIRDAISVIPRDDRARWLALVALAFVSSCLEATAALLVYVVVRIVTEGGNELYVPIVGDLTERFPGTSQDRLFVTLTLGIAAFFLLRGAVSLFQTYAQNRMVQSAGADLSVRLLHGYLRMPYAWHLRHNSAEMIRNALTSVLQVAAYVLLPLVAVLSDALMVFAIVLVLLVKAPAATGLASVVLAPVVWFILRMVRPRAVAAGVDNEEMTRQGLQVIQQSIGGIKDIKLLGRSTYFAEQLRRVRRKQAKALYLSRTFVDAPRVVIETTMMMFILSFLVVSRLRDGDTSGTLGVLGLFAYAVLRVLPALNRTIANLNNIDFASGALRNVVTDLRLRPEHEEVTGDEVVSLDFQEAIRLERVSFRYDDVEDDAVQDVELDIRAGELLGVVGPTGAGKTTLVDLVLGLIAPSRGRITIDNQDIRECLPSWLQTVGVVPQFPFLLDDSLRRNVALGCEDDEIDEGRVAAAVDLARLTSVVTTLPEGLDTVVGERGVRLSGGQRQRVAIARALYRDPQVLVFDEGTSSLDNVTEAEVIAALETLRGTRTIITIAHRLSTVRNCDRVVYMESGRILDVGSFDELLKRSEQFRQQVG